MCVRFLDDGVEATEEDINKIDDKCTWHLEIFKSKKKETSKKRLGILLPSGAGDAFLLSE